MMYKIISLVLCLCVSQVLGKRREGGGKGNPNKKIMRAKCARPSDLQEGTLTQNNDIDGCGLEGCENRFQDNYGTVEECRQGCFNIMDCAAYSWSPMNGNQDNVGKSVCTLYDSVTPNDNMGVVQVFCVPDLIECPNNKNQQYRKVGTLNTYNDIGGCGIEGCGLRFTYYDIVDCARACKRTTDCNAFSWAPQGGDRNNPNSTVCTMYKETTPTGHFGPRQVFCVKDDEPLLKASNVFLHDDLDFYEGYDDGFAIDYEGYDDGYGEEDGGLLFDSGVSFMNGWTSMSSELQVAVVCLIAIAVAMLAVRMCLARGDNNAKTSSTAYGATPEINIQ